MRKHIAFISEHASPLSVLGGIDSGGQNVYVAKLTDELAKRGFAVDIFTRCENKKMPEIVELSSGVRVVNVTAGPLEVLPKEKIFPFMKEFSENMIDFMESQDFLYDLVHANFWMSGWVAMQVKKILNLPFTITFHALGKVRRFYQKEADGFPDVRFEVEEKIMKEADLILAECPQDEEDMKYYYGAHPEKIAQVPCGFDPLEFSPVPREASKKALGLPLNEKIILQLGRMVPRKGVENVIRSFSHLLKDHKVKAKLLIVGGENNPESASMRELRRLMKIAEEENVASDLFFTGPVARENLKFYYSAADIFVTTPWYEPFGITPLEAMACATPVIGSRVGGIKHTVLHGETGFLVPPNDSRSLAAHLAYLFERPEMLKEFGRNALKRVHSLFTWKKIAEQVDGIYHQILDDTWIGEPSFSIKTGL
jgi:D-inositol-3-phosphate glycosyltransferase